MAFFVKAGKGLGVLGPSLSAKHPGAMTGLSLEPYNRDIVLKEFAGGVLNQGGTKSCLAQAHCDAAVTTAAARYGHKLPLPSRRHPYYWLRRRASRWVTDSGGFQSFALETFLKFGFIDERYFPWKTGIFSINAAPPLDVNVAAYGHRKVTGTYAIHGADELDACLHSNRAGVVCSSVDQAFTENEGPSLIGPREGVSLGGHAFQILGVQWVAGRRQYLKKGSWGTDWRDGGYAWLDEWWIHTAYDMAVVDFKES